MPAEASGPQLRNARGAVVRTGVVADEPLAAVAMAQRERARAESEDHGRTGGAIILGIAMVGRSVPWRLRRRHRNGAPLASAARNAIVGPVDARP